MSLNSTANKVWAALEVSSIAEEYQRDQGQMSQTQLTCTQYPCGTGYCNTKMSSNCCIEP